MQRNQNIISYIEKQFIALCSGIDKGNYTFPVFTQLKLQNENGQTNFMNVTQDQLYKIMQVLKERE